jgi:hypothetical protein
MSLSIARFTIPQRRTYQDPGMLMTNEMKLYGKQIFYSYSDEKGHIFNTDPIHNKQEIRVFRRWLDHTDCVEWYNGWIDMTSIYGPTIFTICLKTDFLEREV